jgi:uncharacterized membrane protein
MSSLFQGTLKRIVKSLTWRAIGTAEVFAIAYYTTGHMETAGPIAGLTAVTSTVLYFAHECLWTRAAA